jgi:hypothetical protein
MNKYKTLISVVCTFFLNFTVFAEDQVSSVNKKEQTEVIEAISKQLQDNYIFPKVADKMASHVKKQQKKGRYNKISDPIEFADQLTKDLISISKDKHIRVMFNPEAIARQKLAVTDEEQKTLRQNQIDHAKRANFGFNEVKILDGNIGYLDLRSFSDTSYAGETAVAAMNFLGNTDAIIIDLRQNGGGSPAMIQLITSYLYDVEPVHLNNFYWRPTDLHTQTWTLPHVPGKRSPDTPVYVLTSSRTFSAAEEFSYNLKNLERATLIGETTGGGAHPGDTVNATERFQVWVPSGRAINPITKTNWEGTGVEPHIQVNQAEALNTSHIKALEALKSNSTDEDSKYSYTWTLDTLNAKDSNIQLEPSVMESYVGSYGPRVISLNDNQLFYQRGSGTKYNLKAMSQNEFILEGLSYFRIKFDFKENKVKSLIGKYDNGTTDKNLKDKS